MLTLRRRLLLLLRLARIALAASEFGARVLKPYLQHAFAQARLLRELFEIFGVRVVIELKV
jgi:hypothetical protein